MVTIVQKGDLASTSFANANTNNAQGITVRTDAGSAVKTAIDAAVAAIPNAADTARGLVELAVAANFPQATNDTDAVPTAYLAAAIAALPIDNYVTGLASYNANTNVLTLAMNDGSLVDISMTDVLGDAVVTITAGKVAVFANDDTTLLGHLLPV
jgi:hypothetical protein